MLTRGLKNNMRDLRHPFGSLTVGNPLRLNGKIVALFVTEVLAAVSDLSNFSRNWLSSHPE